MTHSTANRCAVGAIRPNRTLATASSRSATNTNDEPTRAPGKPVALTHLHHDPPMLLTITTGQSASRAEAAAAAAALRIAAN